ncbi:uncharacterized protein G2W53_045202 [Senna tora]|uniref:Uncharacterized protein n=1 Tax=Senna tora TaxID=362788 RepID=A0A834W0A2_9FABA|nr:uncharacterized protein G2W53_045202 [Senna tora]
MGMTSSDLSRLSPNTITLSSASPFKKGGLGESPENGHPTKPTPHEWITLRRDNLYRRDGPLPSNGSISPRPRPTIARQFIPKGRGIYLESHQRNHGKQSRVNPATSPTTLADHRPRNFRRYPHIPRPPLEKGRLHFDPSHAREILPRKKFDPWVIDFGWTAIPVVDHRATDSDGLETSWEASLCHRDHFDSAYAREILPRKKVDPWVIDFGWTAIHAVDRRATDSDGLETSWEASLCHRDQFDSAYAPEILPRKKLTHG